MSIAGNSSELVPPSSVPLGVAALVCRNAPVTGRTGKDFDDVAYEQEFYRERGPAIPSSECAQQVFPRHRGVGERMRCRTSLWSCVARMLLSWRVGILRDPLHLP